MRGRPVSFPARGDPGDGRDREPVALAPGGGPGATRWDGSPGSRPCGGQGLGASGGMECDPLLRRRARVAASGEGGAASPGGDPCGRKRRRLSLAGMRGSVLSARRARGGGGPDAPDSWAARPAPGRRYDPPGRRIPWNSAPGGPLGGRTRTGAALRPGPGPAPFWPAIRAPGASTRGASGPARASATRCRSRRMPQPAIRTSKFLRSGDSA